MKRCSICRKEKQETEFQFQNKALGIRVSACKECRNGRKREYRKKNPEKQKMMDRAAYERQRLNRIAYAKRYREENPEKTRNTNLKVKYGITSEDYDEMYEKQGGKCGICHKHQDDLNRVLCVDHCHVSGNVRGLLCDTCNRFLGFYEQLSDGCKKYLED